ncbi:MAG: metal ABC transporter permease [Candidatus Omnitrophica bacterium]|nr:metal ABC transporter permease [Candidatus Omnitrophota bacterium]
MLDALQYQFMQNAFWAAILASISCGIIGTYVVVKRITFISGGIAHASFGGIGLGYFLQINPLYCLIPFSLLSAVGIGFISKKIKVAEDTTIGIFWSVGMAIGVIFIGLTPGYTPDLFAYLFGNILMVSQIDLVLMIFLNILIIVSVKALFKEFLAMTFDEEYATVSGLNVNAFYIFLLCLIAFTVVILIRIVGIILVIALLTIPAAIARQYTINLFKMMLLSICICLFITLAGLWLSYLFDIASGSTIILLAGTIFSISCGIKLLTKKLIS